jgi:hypothetical protein
MNVPEAAQWLAYARSDLNAAETLRRDPKHYPRQVCFLAQQAAEKSLKVPVEVPSPKLLIRVAPTFSKNTSPTPGKPSASRQARTPPVSGSRQLKAFHLKPAVKVMRAVLAGSPSLFSHVM